MQQAFDRQSKTNNFVCLYLYTSKRVNALTELQDNLDNALDDENSSDHSLAISSQDVMQDQWLCFDRLARVEIATYYIPYLS